MPKLNDPGTVLTPEQVTSPVTDDGDHDRFAHYVLKSEAAAAYIEGTPVRALCGKVWVPSRDPSRYPLCPECKEIKHDIDTNG